MIVIPAILIALAGAAEAVMDFLQFYYDKPNQFWNPKISWENKYKGGEYKNGLTFRGRWLVFTTDGWHLMKWVRNLTLFSSLYFLPEIAIWMPPAAWFVNRIGFNIVFKILK